MTTKRIVSFIIITLAILSCSSSDDSTNANPFLSPINFSFEVNLNLPQYSSLEFSGNHIVDRAAGRGIQGVVIYNFNGDLFSVFELSDPNIRPSECSILEIDGIEASAACGNENVYNIVTGQRVRGDGEFPLLRYRVQREGDVLLISN